MIDADLADHYFSQKGTCWSWFSNRQSSFSFYISGEVDRGEIDEVSLLLADRWNELCRVLEINRNLLQQTYVEPRERVYDILRLWKEAVDHPTRENFIAKLKAMKPFPYDAIDLILLKTEI